MTKQNLESLGMHGEALIWKIFSIKEHEAHKVHYRLCPHGLI